jgi:serine/threonine protein kinase
LHLDVTPKNILIDSDDVVRLTDFGASSQARAGTTASGQRTRLATSLHSFNHCYAAPEQFDGVGRSRSDQYGLFLVFCSLLEGRARTKPAAYHEFRDFDVLTPAQNEVVRTALSTDPDRRFETCGEPARTIADGMAHVPKPVLASDILRLRDDLVRRVDLERQKISSGTARLGGALKLGRGLERLLQASLLWVASEENFDALVALKEIDPHATTLDRSTAGNLVKTLALRTAGRSLPYSEVAPILVDISDKKDSIVWAFINARNDVVHGRRAADAIVPYAARLADLLRQPSS